MKHRLAAISLVALVALASAPSAAAQTPPKSSTAGAQAPAKTATAALTPAQTAAAMELLKAMKVESSLPNTAAAMIDSEIGRNPGLTPYRDVMLNWLKKYMTWSAMAPELARLYGETFTEPELKDLTAFYRTPTGQKALTKMPELTQRSAMIGAKLGQVHSDELKKLMTARSEELAKQQEKTQAGAPKPGEKGPPKQPTSAPKKP